MRYLVGFLCVCALGMMPLVGCSEGGEVQLGDPKLTADGHEVFYNRETYTTECDFFSCWRNVVERQLQVYAVETRTTSQLSLDHSAFDLSSGGGVVAYAKRAGGVAIYDRESGTTTSLGGGGSPLSISGDGQLLAFRSGSGPGSDVGVDIYDRATEQIERAATQPLATLPSLSKHGGFLAYMTGPSLLPDVNPAIYVLDRATGENTLVSVNSDGEPANALSEGPLISGDGRFVAFSSDATNLVAPSSSPPNREVYVHDRETGTTSLISAAADSGEPLGEFSTPYDISADGQFIVYVTGDLGIGRVYRYDAGAGRSTLVSINSSFPSVSDDGRLVAFETSSSDLDPDDVDSETDIYLHDVASGETRWVSER